MNQRIPTQRADKPQRADNHPQSGFSLIELMVVITVIALLTYMAVGQYQGILKRSQRNSAVTALHSAQLMLERTRLQTGNFAGGLSAEQLAQLNQSANGHTISQTIQGNTYRIIARPKQTDTDCGELSISETDIRTASGVLGVVGCW